MIGGSVVIDRKLVRDWSRVKSNSKMQLIKSDKLASVHLVGQVQ